MSGYWLALDTATDVASVAVGRGGEGGSRSVGPPQAGSHVQGARRHAAEIIRLIDFALGRVGIRSAELDGIVVGDGPGSFTGLRIGWAAAKGLAQEAGLDVVASLPLGPVPIAACFDALRGQVYGAQYVIHPDRVETLVAPAVLTIADLASAAPAIPRLVVGDGATRYREAVVEWCGTAPVPLEALPPTATLLLSLRSRAGAGRAIEDLTTAEPTYGRPAEAQARWEARHGRPLPDSPRPSR